MGNCTSKEDPVVKGSTTQLQGKEGSKLSKSKSKLSNVNNTHSSSFVKPNSTSTRSTSENNHHNNTGINVNTGSTSITTTNPNHHNYNIYPTIRHELKWKQLHTQYTTCNTTNNICKIIDPADVHTVLDECIKQSIRKLHSAEMTLLKRRVRKVVRSLLVVQIPSSGGGGGENNNAVVKNVGGVVGKGGGGGGGKMSSSLAPSVSFYNSATTTTTTITTHSNHITDTSNTKSSFISNSSSSSTATPTKSIILPSSKSSSSNNNNTLQLIRSKSIYQQDNVLDEYLIKQIFMGGNQLLRIGMEERWIDKCLDMYKDRLSGKKILGVGGSGSAKVGTSGNNGNGHGSHHSWSGIISSISSPSADGGAVATNTGNNDGNETKRISNAIASNTTETPSTTNATSTQHHGGGGSGKHKNHKRWGPTSRTNTGTGTHNNNNQQQPKNNLSSSQSYVADIFSSAFQLLLYLSEKRWDYVADIAKLSAQNANLILDVNQQIRMVTTTTTTTVQQEEKESGRVGGKGEKDKLSNGHHHHHNQSSSSSSSSNNIPLPPPEYPSSNNNMYKDKLSPPPQLNGITLQEISFLVATALRTSRTKRLILLFYLLLKPETLIELLEKHPAGGVPTWLLEVDNDWILSYASLSHYYYYGGVPSCSPSHSSSTSNATSFEHSGGGGSSSSGGQQQARTLNGLFTPSSSKHSSSSSSKGYEDSTVVHKVKIEKIVAIETIGVLLHYIPQKRSSSNDKVEDESTNINNHHEMNNNRQNNNDNNNNSKVKGRNGKKTTTLPPPPNIQKPNRERTLSYADKKYHAAKMHIMLADYLRKLQLNGAEAPTFENEVEQFQRLERLDTYWDASFAEYIKCKEYYENVNLRGMDDNNDESSWTLDEFMIWASKAIPDDSTLDLIMHQLFGLGLLPSKAMERKLVCESWVEWQLKESKYFSHANDAISIMTLGIKNLLTFSSSKEDSSVVMYGEDDPEYLSLDVTSVWGDIGGFDGKGGLGYGIMYCIEKEWWDQWAGYVAWEWNDGTREYSTCERPHGLSTEKLIEPNSDTVIRGSLGSYEVMKKGLKKDVDYILIPPRVWDILYELYGGGPPLPRMIVQKISNRSIANNASIDIAPREHFAEQPIRVPKSLKVALHPYVLDCRVRFSFRITFPFGKQQQTFDFSYSVSLFFYVS